MLALLALYPAYLGVMWGVRRYTSSLIQGMEGVQLPAFSLTDLQGEVFDNQRLAGKWVVLNFFRSKCHGCRAERGDIRTLGQELDPEKAQLLGIMVDRVQGFPAEVTEQTLADYGYQHPVLMADDAFVDAFHGAGWSQITPITYVADGEGRIVQSFRYPYRVEDVLAVIQS
ncbi:MAG: TlpA disulfide reductase family protein [Planctomycetota bacterium]